MRRISVGLALITFLATRVSAQAFPTPNILNNASFETGWDGFTDWTGAKPPNGVTRDNTRAVDGKSSVLRTWTPNPSGDVGAQFLYRISSTPLNRVWMRFYFRITAPITTVMKFARFYDVGFNTNLGGFGVASGDQILTWGTGFENGSIATPIGLQEKQVVDGQWHSLEVDYWRIGDPSGFPSAAFWFDGVQVGMADDAPVLYKGAGNSSYWSGKRLYAGTRANGTGVGFIELMATLNGGNTTTGEMSMDRIAFSTAGRIGR